MKAKRFISAIAAIALVLNIAACGKIDDGSSSDPKDPIDILTPAKPVYDTMLLSDAVKPFFGTTGKDIDETFKSAQYDFAAELFQRSFNSEQSSLVSPLSVMLALSMTANGADGETLSQMQNVLGGGMDIEELNKYLYTYSGILESDGLGEKAKLSIANSIWYRDVADLKVREEFLQKNADYYGASMFQAPFNDETVYAINSWVIDHTDGMIDKIVDEIDPDTMMYLINAVTFDAQWTEQYEEYQIGEMPFTDINGNKQTAQMMSSTEDIYLEGDGVQGFMKTYKGGKYAFAALLPDEGVSIEEYISSLTGEALAEAFTPKYGYTVHAQMPKFSFDYDISLNDVLKDMGMTNAFENADFSRMAEMELYISKVLHKTHIDVDENGTKAGAVTSVTTDCEGAIMEDKPVYITLDRPFVFAIVDRETNLPIFLGATLTVE